VLYVYVSVVLKVMASLIRQSQQDDVTMEVKKLFLTDLSSFCVNSRENRRYDLVSEFQHASVKFAG